MPSRPYQLDTGFDTNPLLPPSGSQPPDMPPDPFAGLTGAQVMERRPDRDLYGAAFRMENDVVNAVDLLTRPVYQDDDTFDLEARLKQSGLWQQYAWNFIGVGSEAEFTDLARRISQEEKDRELLSSSGLAGFVAMTVAGLASPVNLLPFVGPGVRGAKAVAVGAGYGVAAGVLQEAPLQLNQSTRTAEESLFSIGMSTVLGGVLGGAVGYLNRPMKEIADDMAPLPRDETIPEPGPQAGGADVAPPRLDAGPLKTAPIGFEHIPGTKIETPLLNADQTQEAFNKLGPVTRVLSNPADDAQARWMMSQISDGGLQMSGNARGIPTAEGGTVENLVLVRWGKVAEAIKKLDDAYARYMLGKQGRSTVFERARANVMGLVNRRTKLSKSEFKAEISRAFRNNFESDIPEAAEAARFWFDTVAAPTFKEATDLGVIKLPRLREDGSNADLGDDMSWLIRDYDQQAIAAYREEFIEIIARDFEERLAADFQAQLGKLLEKLGKETQRVTDMTRPLDEVNALREQFLKELEELKPAEGSADEYIEDAIADLRSMANDKKLSPEQRADARAKAKLMEERAGPKYGDRKARRKAIRERLTSLNRSVASKRAERAAKLNSIGRQEEMALTTLNRTVRSAQRTLAKLESATDENFATEITDLRNKFARVADEYDRAEERITKLAGGQDVEAPPPVKGMTRVYHGGGADDLDPQSFDDLWVTPHFEYARDYRTDGITQNNVWYVDIPDTELLELGLKDEVNGYLINAKIPAKWAKQVKALKQKQATADLDPLITADLKQTDRAGRLSDIAEELETVESIDREALRVLIQEGLDEMLQKVNRLNGRRFVRAEKLKAEVEDLDPKKLEAEVERLRLVSSNRQADFMERWQTEGARRVEVREGFQADFSAKAKEIAEKVTQKIQGTHARLAGMDLIMEPKGSEIARSLKISSNKIEKFLNNDIEHLMSQYIRTIGADIELYKKFGEFAPDGGRNLEFEKLAKSEVAKRKQVTEEMRAKGASAEEIAKRMLKLDKVYSDIRRDLEVVIGRLRHTHGIPADPTALSARLGAIALHANVARYMGMVVNSSIPDVGRPIAKYGAMKTFRRGWVGFAKNLAKGKFTLRELNFAGVSVDMLMHTRAREMSDIGDYMVRGSKFEKSLEYVSNKMGLIAAFDIWTTAMKQITGIVANAELMDDIKAVMEGTAKTKSIERLAGDGIDADRAKLIWNELTQPGGSEIVDGQLWPNTENWKSKDAVEAYRAALLREVNNAITTPGLEKPIMADSSLAGRLVWQFKSFATASTTKTFMAGLQQHDMALVQGVSVQLALGALSYYIWANLRGGQVAEELNADLQAGKYERLLDEAISRSGVLGMISFGIDVASTVPMVAPGVTFAGERTTRQADNDFWQAVGGPSYDLVSRLARGLPQADGEWDRSEAHQLRLMAPLQNHFLLRHAYDMIEKAVPE